MTTTLAEIGVLLDLPDCDTTDELIRLLQERRAWQADALASQMPDQLPLATTVRLRATQRREIQLCEDALTELGAPFVASNLEETP